MSDYSPKNEIDKNLEKLLKHASPNSNDRRHKEYVDYINGFLEYFGDERAYLVGSTAEMTKLRTSCDNSDADFLLVSGRFSIPVNEIEPRSDMSNFVWVRGEHLDKAKQLGVDMVDVDGKKYLPGEILHSVDPKLFTILRGIYKCVNSVSDSIPGRQTRVTTIGETSSVGLARTEFRGLEVIDKEKIPLLKRYFPKRLPPRNYKIKKPRANEARVETTKILELMAAMSVPTNPLNHEGQYSHFTDIVRLLLKRQKEETLNKRGNEPLVSFKDSENDMCDDDDDFERYENVFAQPNDEMKDLPTNVRATYAEKTMKDFVPAIRILGRLPCLELWFRENGKWLPDQTKERIRNSEIYVVAKNAPINPDGRDFCLAFNHAEIMLTDALTPAQRKCLLVMKAIHKGVFGRIMKSFDTSHKLKSFHLKTALYWVLEETVGSAIWMDENLIGAIRRVLFYLRTALEERRLLHYFTRSNLFAGYDERLCKDLIQGIDNIVADPNKGLEQFFALEEEGKPVIILNEEQVRHLVDLSGDGGVTKEVNVLEEVTYDFERGFDETRQEKGYIPLKEAVNRVMTLYLQSEGERKATEELRKLDIPAPENICGVLAGFLGNLASASSQIQSTSNQCTPGQSNLYTGGAAHLQSDRGRINISQQQQESQSVQSHHTPASTPDVGNQLAAAVNTFFERSTRGEQRQTLNLVKQLGILEFLGKPE